MRPAAMDADRRPGCWERARKARKSSRLRTKMRALTAAAGFSSEHRNLFCSAPRGQCRSSVRQVQARAAALAGVGRLPAGVAWSGGSGASAYAASAPAPAPARSHQVELSLLRAWLIASSAAGWDGHHHDGGPLTLSQ